MIIYLGCRRQREEVDRGGVRRQPGIRFWVRLGGSGSGISRAVAVAERTLQLRSGQAASVPTQEEQFLSPHSGLDRLRLSPTASPWAAFFRRFAARRIRLHLN